MNDELESQNNFDDTTEVPFSTSAENSVIGGLILNNDAFDSINQILDESDFYQVKTRLIFATMKRLSDNAQVFDVLILVEELRKNQVLDKVGGDEYLISIAANTPTVSNLQAYARRVKDFSIRRKLINASQAIADRSYRPDKKSADELLDLAETDIFAVSQNRTKEDKVLDMAKLLKNTMNNLQRLSSLRGELSGIATGFVDLDKMTSGIQRADLIVLAGRPSMGKTSLAMNIVENILLKQTNEDGFVLFFSMEMPSEQIMMRMLASIGKVNQSKIRNGDLGDEEWDGIISATKLLQNKRFYIDDTASLSPNDAKATARRLVKSYGKLDLIVLDYLQLMQMPGSENRTNEISQISRALKAMAKEFNCPVIVLSQLNRSLENRSGKDKRPIMSDLRDSGAIEQDADVIAFIYRDEVYHKEDTSNAGQAELIIGKQRNGPIGTVHLRFDGQYTKFSTPARTNYDDLDMGESFS